MIGRITKNRPEAQPPLAEKGTGAPKIVYSHVGVSVRQLTILLDDMLLSSFRAPELFHPSHLII